MQIGTRVVLEQWHKMIKIRGSGGQGSRSQEAEIRFGGLAETSCSPAPLESSRFWPLDALCKHGLCRSKMYIRLSVTLRGIVWTRPNVFWNFFAVW